VSRILASTILGVLSFVVIGSAVAGNPAVPGVGDGAAVAAAAPSLAPRRPPPRLSSRPHHRTSNYPSDTATCRLPSGPHPSTS
jgi:hypothetical protein